MENETTTHEAKKGGVPNQAALYSAVVKRSDEIIQTLFDALVHKNENIRISAAKTLLNKILPDIRSVELSGKNGEPIQLSVIGGADFLAWQQKSSAASGESTLPDTTTVQDIGVAQTGTKDINSDTPTGEVEST